MEKNFETGAIGFSSWETETSKTDDKDTQTKDISSNEISLQVKTSVHKCEGTEDTSQTTDDVTNYDDVAIFLRKAEVLIMKELTKCRKFNEQLKTTECSAVDSSCLKVPFRPTVLFTYDMPSLEAELKLTSIEIDRKGIKLAVAYSATSHKSWCVHHSSYILIFNIAKITKSVDKNINRENLRISCPSCVTILAYDGNILYAGTFSGELLKIDYKGDIIERLNHHNSAISAILFISSKTVVTLDNEGYIVKLDGNSVATSLFVDLPITCGTILNYEKLLFGTELGTILLLEDNSVARKFKCNTGQKVNHLSVHPNKRLFCSSTDFEITLYDSNQEEPVKIINMFSLALWMPNSNLLCWAKDPVIYQVNEFDWSLSVISELSADTNQQLINSSDSVIRISEDKPHLLYEGKQGGILRVWNCIV